MKTHVQSCSAIRASEDSIQQLPNDTSICGHLHHGRVSDKREDINCGSCLRILKAKRYPPQCMILNPNPHKLKTFIDPAPPNDA